MFYVRRTRSVHCMIKHTCRRPYGAVGLGRSPADDPSPLFAYRVRALDGSRGPRPSHAEPEKRITAAGLMDLLADRHGVARWISAVRPTAARLFNDQPSDAPTPLLTTRWNPTRSWFPPLFFSHTLHKAIRLQLHLCGTLFKVSWCGSCRLRTWVRSGRHLLFLHLQIDL